MSDYVDYDPAEQAELEQQIADLLNARAQVQAQTRALQGDLGGFRAEQELAWEAAHTASVELATAQGGDFYSADVGQQIAPDGGVTYDFDQAHLRARGVDFDAGGTAGQAPNSVRWLRQADGSVLAYITGLDQVPIGGPAALWQGVQLPNGAGSTLRMQASAPAVGQLWADASDGVTTSQRLVIDSLGQSNFPQLPAVQKLILDGPFTYTATVAPQAFSTSPTFSLVNAVPGGGAIVPIGAITVAAADPAQVAFHWTVQFAVDAQHFTVVLFNAAAAGTPSRKVTWQGMVLHA
jgi:hypothetical protein